MTILVTGATGAVGRHLVEELVSAGQSVRAISRTPETAALPAGVEVVAADLADPTSLGDTVFAGVDRLFVFPAAAGVEALLERASDNKVSRAVLLSSLAAAAEHPRDIGSASFTHHRELESAVAAHFDDWTYLRPGTFSNNLLSWAWPIKSGAPIRAPYIHSAQAPIHEADVAAAAAVVLTQDGHAGKAYPLTGPEALTRIQQVEAIGAAIGRRIELVEITPDEFRSDVAEFITDDIVAMLLDYWADTVSEPDVVRSVESLTGLPGRTVAQWAIDHRADFS